MQRHAARPAPDVRHGKIFAPLTTPLNRRSQTLAIFIMIMFLPFAIIVNLLIAGATLLWVYYYVSDFQRVEAAFFRWLPTADKQLASEIAFATLPTWLLFVAVYLVWVNFVDKRHIGRGARWKWLCAGPFAKHYRDYFPAQCYFDETQAHRGPFFKDKERYLIACHPHGLFGFGVWTTWVCFGDLIDRAIFQRGFCVTAHTMAMNFRVPLWREFLLWFGFCDVSKESLLRSLKGKGNNGHIAVLVPGGAAESLDCCRPRLTLAARKGFVKIAVQAEAHLVPVYTFGETSLYVPMTQGGVTPHLIRGLRKVLGVGTPLVCGRGVFNYVFGLLPRRVPLHTVIGQPIDTVGFLKRQANRRKEAGTKLTEAEAHSADVTALHRFYIEKVQELYEKYQPIFAPAERHSLEFI